MIDSKMQSHAPLIHYLAGLDEIIEGGENQLELKQLLKYLEKVLFY